jgi:serine/threonine protein kinase
VELEDTLPAQVLEKLRSTGVVLLADLDSVREVEVSCNKDRFDAGTIYDELCRRFCGAFQQYAKRPPKASDSAYQWIMCDLCRKWRTTTPDIIRAFGRVAFHCAQNDPGHLTSCSGPQEDYSDEAEVGGLPQTSTLACLFTFHTVLQSILAEFKDGVPLARRPMRPLCEEPLPFADFEVQWEGAPVTTTPTCAIRKGFWIPRGRELVCIKDFDDHGNTDELLQLLKAERTAQSSVAHENVGRSYGWISDPPCLVTEWIEGRNLSLCLLPRGQPCELTKTERLVILCDIARGLCALHAARVSNCGPGRSERVLGQIAHFDIKPENVMVTPEKRAKLIDFGLSRMATGTDLFTIKHSVVRAGYGTPLYMPPEAVDVRAINKLPWHDQLKCDVYCFGLVALEALSVVRLKVHLKGDMPRTCHGQGGFFERLQLENDDVGTNLVKACCAEDPARRPAMTAVRAACALTEPLRSKPRPVLQVLQTLTAMLQTAGVPTVRLYRLVRPSENAREIWSKGLQPCREERDANGLPDAVQRHVRSGSSSAAAAESPFLSFSEDLEWVLWWWCKGCIENHKAAEDGLVAEVQTERLDQVRLFNLSTKEAAAKHIPPGMAQEFATVAKEWLFAGRIRPNQVSGLYQLNRSSIAANVLRITKTHLPLRQGLLKGFNDWRAAVRKELPLLDLKAILQTACLEIGQ